MAPGSPVRYSVARIGFEMLIRRRFKRDFKVQYDEKLEARAYVSFILRIVPGFGVEHLFCKLRALGLTSRA